MARAVPRKKTVLAEGGGRRWTADTEHRVGEFPDARVSFGAFLPHSPVASTGRRWTTCIPFLGRQAVFIPRRISLKPPRMHAHRT